MDNSWRHYLCKTLFQTQISIVCSALMRMFTSKWMLTKQPRNFNFAICWWLHRLYPSALLHILWSNATDGGNYFAGVLYCRSQTTPDNCSVYLSKQVIEQQNNSATCINDEHILIYSETTMYLYDFYSNSLLVDILIRVVIFQTYSLPKM